MKKNTEPVKGGDAMSSMPLEIPLACGCKAVWKSVEAQYISRCTHPDHMLRKARHQSAARRQSRDESKRRSDAPLYRQPFSVLR
jgi:hypothetical protein